MSKRKELVRLFNTIVITLLAVGLILVCSRFIHLGKVEYTDNAVVLRDLTPVNTRVQGYIREIRFEEFQHVSKGDTLVLIEDAEFRLALAQARAGLESSRSESGVISASMSTTDRNVSAASEGVSAADASVAEAKAGMETAKKDYDRYTVLLQKGAVTQQQFDHIRTQYEQALSRYEAAVARARQASASKEATAGVLNEQQQRLAQSEAGTAVAEAALDLAELNLSYTVVTAPCDGYAGRKDIQEGQLVQPGQLLLSVVDDSDVWVIANYREHQMKHILNGSPVTFKVDAIPGIRYNGYVHSISAATGSAYSHVPVDNSTGNFVKVEQRVPVKINLTEDNPKEDIERLLSGLNAQVKVKYGKQ